MFVSLSNSPYWFSHAHKTVRMHSLPPSRLSACQGSDYRLIIAQCLLRRQTVLSTCFFFLMSFPHSEAFLASFVLILHEKRPKKRPSSPLLKKSKLIIGLS